LRKRQCGDVNSCRKKGGRGILKNKRIDSINVMKRISVRITKRSSPIKSRLLIVVITGKGEKEYISHYSTLLSTFRIHLDILADDSFFINTSLILSLLRIVFRIKRFIISFKLKMTRRHQLTSRWVNN